MDAQRAVTFLEVPKVIKEAMDDFNRIFGRSYSPFLEKYRMEDAQYAFFVQGAHANTCQSAINHLRKKGLKVGMVRPRWVRPWPTIEICDALSNVKAVATVETSTSYGGAMRGGNLIHELRASLYDLPKRPKVISFMAGLGGDVIMFEDYYYMANILKSVEKDRNTHKVVYWIGFEEREEE